MAAPFSHSESQIPEPQVPNPQILEAQARSNPEGQRRWLWSLPLILVVAGVGLNLNRWLPLSQAEAGPELEAALPVETLTVEPVSNYATASQYTGTVVARRRSELGFERSGQVTQLRVDDGDTVEAGEILAQLDVRSLEAQRAALVAQKNGAIARLQELQVGPRVEDIQAAQAAVTDLEQQMALADLTRERWQALYTEGAVSRQQFDESDFSASALEARLQQAKTQLRELQNGTRPEQIAAQQAVVAQLDAQIRNLDVELDKSVLKAPFTGKVAQRLIDEGTVIGAGQPALSLVEQGVLEARIGLPVELATTVTPGDAYAVQIGSRIYDSTIQSVLPELDDPTRTVTVVLQLPAAAPVKPGEIAQLSLNSTQTPTEQSFWLPTTALVQGDRGLWSSYALLPAVSEPSEPEPVAGETNASSAAFTVEARPVEILETESDRVLVRGLLQPGDRIVAAGAHRIVPGQAVQPTD